MKPEVKKQILSNAPYLLFVYLFGKPFMPEASPADRAAALIELAEKNAPRLGSEERQLIVAYAEAMDDTEKAIGLINRLCEQGYEMQHGHMDDFMKSQIESEIAPGDFKSHVAVLRNGRIMREARRIVAGLKELSAPNRPNKTHFMVELSPYFVQIASSKDTDRLFSMLPYKSLCFTGMRDRHGLYAVIHKDENREKEVRRPRASIRRQLSETKQASAPKKAPPHTKKNELEV